MQIKIAAGNPSGEKCRVLVVGCFEKDLEAPFIAGFDKVLRGCLGSLSATGEFVGKLNDSAMIHTLGRMAPERLLLVGLGKKKELTLDRVRQAAGTAAQTLKKARLKKAVSLRSAWAARRSPPR